MTIQVEVSCFADWRSAARKLAAAQVAPHDIQWSTQANVDDLFAAQQQDAPAVQATGGGVASLQVPRKLLDMLEMASCFNAADRWSFLYKVLWRWSGGDRAVMSA